jgi:hypothetical protein
MCVWDWYSFYLGEVVDVVSDVVRSEKLYK